MNQANPSLATGTILANNQTMASMHSPSPAAGGKKRFNLASNDIPGHLKLTQDRQAYMTFLEVQLERVTQACTNALSFQEKVEGL